MKTLAGGLYIKIGFVEMKRMSRGSCCATESQGPLWRNTMRAMTTGKMKDPSSECKRGKERGRERNINCCLPHTPRLGICAWTRDPTPWTRVLTCNLGELYWIAPNDADHNIPACAHACTQLHMSLAAFTHLIPTHRPGQLHLN